MKMSHLTSTMLVLLGASGAVACDPGELDEEALADSEGDEQTDAEEGFELSPLPEDPSLGSELNPLADYGNYRGGSGGTAFNLNCPPFTSAVGLAASETSSGNLVRQVAVVCAPDFDIAAGVPSSEVSQVVSSSSYHNGSTYVSASTNSRSLWDLSALSPIPSARYKAPGTSYHLCNPGYRLSSIAVRSGSYVDRIAGITCWWDGAGNPPGGGVVYSNTISIGGWGGSHGSTSCQNTDELFADGLFVRSGALLDGIRIYCNE